MQDAVGGERSHARRIGPLGPLAHTAAQMAAAARMTMRPGARRGWRSAVVVGGSALALLAMRRRGVPAAAALAIAGGWAAYRRLGRHKLSSRPVQAAVTIGRPVDEVAARWRDPQLMRAVMMPFTDADDANALELRPAPGDRGTELLVRVDDARRVAAASPAEARLLLLRALRRFKSLVESGEAPTIRGQPAARADRE